MIILKLYNYFKGRIDRELRIYYKKKYSIEKSVKIYNPTITFFRGNIFVKENTYINSGRFMSGRNSKIVIGKHCAIGHNVTISSITHDKEFATGGNLRHIESDIFVGNKVWIGSNVFIKEGITIGDNCIIGANSVVTKNFPNDSILAGNPAKIIQIK